MNEKRGESPFTEAGMNEEFKRAAEEAATSGDRHLRRSASALAADSAGGVDSVEASRLSVIEANIPRMTRQEFNMIALEAAARAAENQEDPLKAVDMVIAVTKTLCACDPSELD